jgi:hypothetical protein
MRAAAPEIPTHPPNHHHHHHHHHHHPAQLLIADFFFIMVALAWLAAGLAEKAAVHSDNLIGAWMPLWPMVFQPAIGILMAGALVSGGIGWVQENLGKQQQR